MDTLESVDGVDRRITRRALTDISSPRPSISVLNVFTEDVRANIARNLTISPSASPEEIVIQQRGRRKMPVTWSPDIDHAKRYGPPMKERTPVKTPVKSSIVLRPTPRKRLLLTDSKDITGATPEKVLKKTPSPWKKVRADRAAATVALTSSPSSIALSPLQISLKGLSPGQLIGVIESLIDEHPDLETKVINSLPTPDLAPLEEKLTYLKSNIYKSLPTSRLTSKTDSPAYSRASTHVNAFKKCVIDQGKLLVESEHWNSVVDYAVMAFRYVCLTPLWDNPPHNGSRKQCFQALTSQVIQALKQGSWTRSQLDNIISKFYKYGSEDRDAESSVKQIITMCKSKQI